MRFLHVFYHHFHLLFALTHQAHESELCSPSVVLCTQTQFDVKSFCLEWRGKGNQPVITLEEVYVYTLYFPPGEIKLCEKLDKHVVGEVCIRKPIMLISTYSLELTLVLQFKLGSNLFLVSWLLPRLIRFFSCVLLREVILVLCVMATSSLGASLGWSFCGCSLNLISFN